MCKVNSTRMTGVLLIVASTCCGVSCAEVGDISALDSRSTDDASDGVEMLWQGACTTGVLRDDPSCVTTGPDGHGVAGGWWGDGVCGDGIVAWAEECDDANLEDGDGCGAACTSEVLSEADDDRNGSPEGAVDLGRFVLAEGVIRGSGDRDFWRLRLWETTRIGIDVSGGSPLDTCNVISDSDNQSMLFEPRLAIVLPNGRTYLEFDSNCGLSANEQDAFDLEVC
jgi:cysteine-rich repeat protein